MVLALKQAWTARGYGATLQKIGWNVKEWSDTYFRITDVAKRIDIEGANALVKSRVVPIVEKVVPLLRSLFARVAPALTHQVKSD